MNTPVDKNAVALLKRWESLRNDRLPYETQWNDIQKLVRVNAKTLHAQSEGDRRFDGIYDSTAVTALEDLAGGLHSYMTSPAERWFGLEIAGNPQLNQRHDVRLWCEQVADIIYDVLKIPAVSFTTSIHESYLDLGAFGHCVLFQEAEHDVATCFRVFPVADCWTAENAYGKVDTVFRQINYTGRQILQEWPSAPADFQKPENQEKMFKIVHCVYPRADRNPVRLDGKNKKFASFYVCEELKCVIDEGGYNEFPYHVPRWFKISDEKYGRSPAMKCLADIKMLNKLEITTLRAGTKQVDPPLVIPDDGFLLPIKTHPGALIFKENGSGDIQSLPHEGNLPWAEEKCAQKRESIRKAFHSDWVLRQRKNANVEQSATEISDDREEALRMMSPMLGRLQDELLGPLLERTFILVYNKRWLPEPPAAIRGKEIKMNYVSPAARAQVATKATGIGRTLTDIAPIAQLNPSVMDAIDLDAAVQELALARGASRKIIRSPEAIAQLRKSRQQQEQATAAAQMMEPASKAALNMAKAREAGGMGA